MVKSCSTCNKCSLRNKPNHIRICETCRTCKKCRPYSCPHRTKIYNCPICYNNYKKPISNIYICKKPIRKIKNKRKRIPQKSITFSEKVDKLLDYICNKNTVADRTKIMDEILEEIYIYAT